MTYHIYIRVSTEDQSLGIDAQRAAIQRWLPAQATTVEHIDEGVSGGAPLERRPALQDALAALRHGDTLVSYRRDRLSRDPLVAMVVERAVARAGAVLVTLDTGGATGPERDLLHRMLDGVAEYERSVLRSRTKAALAARRARGLRTGGVPYGYKVGADNRLLPEPTEQQVIAHVKALSDTGLSLRGISGELAQRGLMSRTGRPFSAQSIKRIVTNYSRTGDAHGAE